MSGVDLRAAALRLDDERKALEASLEATLEELGPVGTTSPLIDQEGFPRADIDVLAVRVLRQRAACLRTDLIAKAAEAEAALLSLHALGPVALLELPPLEGAKPRRAPAPAHHAPSALTPFAVFDSVAVGGPAAAAGVAVGDKLLSFGRLPLLAQGGGVQRPSLSDVASEVGTVGVGAAIRVQVLRMGGQGEEGDAAIVVPLTLTPARWAGQGVLGCHLLPLP